MRGEVEIEVEGEEDKGEVVEATAGR